MDIEGLPDERMAVIVMGRKIGDCIAWDVIDYGVDLFYNFQPINPALPCGDVQIEYVKGIICTVDDDGKKINPLDLYEHLPIDRTEGIY